MTDTPAATPVAPVAAAAPGRARARWPGVTVLDLATVGPAARCTRLLADYGATVVKVGAVPGPGRRAHPAPRSTPTAGRATCCARPST